MGTTIKWILDSGCTFHMTSNKVVEVGSVKMRMFDGMVRTLLDVKHVPGLKKNLISLGTLDKIGCRITCEG